MICSTIIPTIGRPSLTRAVESVLQQDLRGVDFEVLVINDSGNPLFKADWQESERVQIITTQRRERSIARNTGAALARGQYLHFLDDDDRIEPGAYRHLWELSQISDAKWLYGMTQLVDRQDCPSIQLRHELSGNGFVQVMAGEWIPLQSSWIDRKTFMRLGGFNPLLTGPEDIDLLRRILLEEELAETPNMIARVIMAGEGSTTDYIHHPQASRQAREAILDDAGVQRRMRLSAGGPFWRGRMLRIYLTSTVWNLQHRRILTMASRASSSMACLITTDILSPKFWQAVSNPYASITFARGIEAADRAK